MYLSDLLPVYFVIERFKTTVYYNNELVNAITSYIFQIFRLEKFHYYNITLFENPCNPKNV